MCGVIYEKKNKVMERFAWQKERGLDSIGTITKAGEVFTSCANDNLNTFVCNTLEGNRVFGENVYKTKKDFYKDIYDWSLYGVDDEEKILFHHRKASVGKVTLDNAHPFKGEKYTLFQNGTDNKMCDWGKIEGVDDGKTDSYCILKFLELHGDTLEDAAKWLTHLDEDANVSLGVVVVTQGDRILVYSDGCRELFIQRNEDKSEVEWFSSLELNKFPKTKCYGYLIMDWEGKVEVDEIVNENLEVKPTVPATYQGQTSFPSDDDFDSRWSNRGSSTPAIKWYDKELLLVYPSTTKVVENNTKKKGSPKKPVPDVSVSKRLHSTISKFNKFRKGLLKGKVKYISANIPILSALIVDDCSKAIEEGYKLGFTTEGEKTEKKVIEFVCSIRDYLKNEKETKKFITNDKELCEKFDKALQSLSALVD